MSRLALLIKGSALRGVESIVAIVCGFLTLPIMLNGLGQDVYGLWVLITSFAAMMYLFDLGFASAVTRNITLCISNSDSNGANKVINSALLIYCCISVIIILFILIVANYFTPTLVAGVSSSDFRLVLLLIGVGMALDFPAKAFAGLFSAHYRYDLQSSYKILFKIFHTTLLIILIKLNFGIVAVATLSVTLSLLDTVVFISMSKYVFKSMRVSYKYVEKDQLLDLYRFSIWALAIDVGNMARSRMDLFFIGVFVSYSAVSIYYIPVRLVDYSIQLLYRMLGITLPIFAGHVGGENKEKIAEDLLTIGRLNSYFAVGTLTFYIFFGESLLKLWMGAEYNASVGSIVLIILLSGRLSMLVTDPFNNCLYAFGAHRLLAVFTVIEILLMLIGLIYSCYIMEANILLVAASMSLPLVISRTIFYPAKVIQSLNIAGGLLLVANIYRPFILLIPLFMFHEVIGSLKITGASLFIISTLVILTTFLGFMSLELKNRERDILSNLKDAAGRRVRGILK